MADHPGGEASECCTNVEAPAGMPAGDGEFGRVGAPPTQPTVVHRLRSNVDRGHPLLLHHHGGQSQSFKSALPRPGSSRGQKSGAATPERYRSAFHKLKTLFLWAACIAVAETAYQEFVLAIGVGGCSRDNYADEKCNTLLTYVDRYPRLLVQLTCYLFTVIVHATHFRKTRECRALFRQADQLAAGDTALTDKQLQLLAGHWTPSATKELFTETCLLIANTQLTIIVLVLPATLIVSVTNLRQWGRWYDVENYPDYVDDMIRSCCPSGQIKLSPQCDSMCQAGLVTKDGLQALSAGLLCCLSASVVFLPINLWSPVTSMATEHLQMRGIQRVLSLSAIVFWLGCCGNTILFFIYVATRLIGSVESSLFWQVFLVLGLLITSAELILFLWSVGMGALSTFPRKIGDQMVLQWQFIRQTATWAKRRTSSVSHSSESVHGETMSPKDHTVFWKCRCSAQNRQLVLLYCVLYVFAVDVSVRPGISLPELWAIRGLSLFLLLVMRDETSGFRYLKNSGAGFGLVINAQSLRKAILAHLGGKGCKRLIPSYKATILRMADTLAVSYRWQETETSLAPGLSFNMTDWQLQELAQAIKETKPMYVWIDKCSVPQRSGLLKRTLLARMMAVYASAFATLVLRSVEAEGDRYHQRAWTLQEYCNSRRLKVVTQESEATEDGVIAVDGNEGHVFEVLRREHLMRQVHAIPLWLSGATTLISGLQHSDALQVWETFNELKSSLNCLYPKDIIRALYPLLWNAPAEHEDELMAIMDAITDVHGIPQAELKELLRHVSRADVASIHVDDIP